MTRYAPSSAPDQHQKLSIDAAQAHWQLDLLGLDERQAHIRAIPHKGMSGPAFNGNFAMDLEQAEQWQQTGRGIYLQPNIGGTRACEITACTALFIEYDDRAIEAQTGIWKELALPEPTFQIWTGGRSIHQYWVLAVPVKPDEWTGLLERLITYAVGCDKSCKGANRMMRMAGSWYIDRNGNATGRSKMINTTGIRYEAELFNGLLPVIPTKEPCQKKTRTSRKATGKGIREIIEALSQIPQRVQGTNSYAKYRNLLWGLIAACEEAGYGMEAAIQLMEDHSPSRECGWNVQQIAESGGEEINAGTFWWLARQEVWRNQDA